MKRVLLLGIFVLAFVAAAMAQSPPSSTFPKEQAYFDRINADEQNIMLLNDSEILFTKIAFTLNKDATRARLTVQAMPDCPENAPTQPRTLQCFFVSSQSFDQDADVKNSTIYFKVPKSWLDANRYDPISIDLNRYSYSWNVGANLSDWRKLDTSLEDEDGSYAYYSATADGFSYFSITSDGSSTIVKNETAAAETSPAIEQPFSEPVQTHKYSLETAASSRWSVDGRLVTIIVLVLLAIIVFRLRYSEHLTKPEPTHEEKHLEYLTDTIYHFIKAGYRPEMIKDELKRSGWKEWMIDFASIKAKKLK